MGCEVFLVPLYRGRRELAFLYRRKLAEVIYQHIYWLSMRNSRKRQFLRVSQAEPDCRGGHGGSGRFPERASSSIPSLRGMIRERRAFLGVRHFHTRADFQQAVYSGLSFEFRQVLLRLSRGAPPEKAIGGGTKNRRWMETAVSVTGLPIELPALRDSVALGTAVLTGHGAGRFPGAASAPRFRQRGLYPRGHGGLRISAGSHRETPAHSGTANFRIVGAPLCGSNSFENGITPRFAPRALFWWGFCCR